MYNHRGVEAVEFLLVQVKTFPQGRTKLWLTCGKEVGPTGPVGN